MYQESTADVSIIIPVYNVEEYIGECLESVIAQSDDYKIECIIVDDCGSDNSMKVAEEIVDNYSGPIDFRILRHDKNKGLSAARNTGIRAATGRYLYFLDSDDLITPDCIKTLMATAIVHPDVEVVTADFKTFPTEGYCSSLNLIGKDLPLYTNDKKQIRSFWLSKYPVTAWNKIISREFLLNNNLFFKEGIIHEDDHWMANAYHHISSVGAVEKVTYLYRIRPGSITQNNNATARRIRNFYYLIALDLAAKPAEYDQIWTNFIFDAITSLKVCTLNKEEIWEGFDIQFSKTQMVHNITGAILRNHSVPLAVKILFLGYSLPYHLGQVRLFQKLSNLYFRIK